MNWCLSLFLSLAMCTIARPALATYLRLVPVFRMNVDEANKKVTIAWTVTNEGDEAAEAVALDFPAFSEAYTMSSELPPRSSATKTLVFPFAKLGIDKRGTYSLIYRINYKDANMFPFSATHLASIPLPPEVSRVLLLHLEGGTRPVSIVQQRKKTMTLKVQNASQKELNLEKLEVLAPVEILARLDDVVTPVRLAAGAERTLKLSLISSQALIGSAYAVGLLVSGTTEGKHFSEAVTFVANIVESSYNTRMMIMALVIIVLALLWWNPFTMRVRKRK